MEKIRQSGHNSGRKPKGLRVRSWILYVIYHLYRPRLLNCANPQISREREVWLCLLDNLANKVTGSLRVDAERNLIEIFEAKIKAKLDEIWGEV